MVQVLVLHHAEALARDAAEDLARGPGGARATLAEALDEITQATDIRFPRRGGHGEELGWTLAHPLGPGDEVNDDPIQRRARERARWRSGIQLAQCLSQVGAHVADHLGSGEATPERLAIGAQPRDAVENRSACLDV